MFYSNVFRWSTRGEQKLTKCKYNMTELSPRKNKVNRNLSNESISSTIDIRILTEFDFNKEAQRTSKSKLNTEVELIKHKFQWKKKGEQIYLVGSFTRVRKSIKYLSQINKFCRHPMTGFKLTTRKLNCIYLKEHTLIDTLLMANIKLIHLFS